MLTVTSLNCGIMGDFYFLFYIFLSIKIRAFIALTVKREKKKEHYPFSPKALKAGYGIT